MTTQEYSASKCALPFGQKTKTRNAPCWCKIGHGFTVITDGAEKTPYVAPGHIYAVTISEDGKPVINSYWPTDSLTGLKATRPFSFTYLRRQVYRDNLVPAETDISFEQLIGSVTAMHPTAWIPSKEAFYAEYGLVYDTATEEITNPENLA